MCCARPRRPAGAPPIRFVLFDGEESPDDAKDFYATGLRGSRPYARRHADEIRALILLDFVAEKGAHADPARGRLAPRAVDAPARRRAQASARRRRSRTTRPAR